MTEAQLGNILSVYGALMWIAVIYGIYRYIKWRRQRVQVSSNLLTEAEAARAAARNRLQGDLHESPYSEDIIVLDRAARQITVGTLFNPITVSFNALRDADVVTGHVTLTRADRHEGFFAIRADGTDYADTVALRRTMLADRMSKELLTELSVKVTIDNWENPVHTICFLRMASGGIDPRSDRGAEAIALVNKIHAQLDLIIHENSKLTPAALPS